MRPPGPRAPSSNSCNCSIGGKPNNIWSLPYFPLFHCTVCTCPTVPPPPSPPSPHSRSLAPRTPALHVCLSDSILLPFFCSFLLLKFIPPPLSFPHPSWVWFLNLDCMWHCVHMHVHKCVHGHVHGRVHARDAYISALICGFTSIVRYLRPNFFFSHLQFGQWPTLTSFLSFSFFFFPPYAPGYISSTTILRSDEHYTQHPGQHPVLHQVQLRRRDHVTHIFVQSPYWAFQGWCLCWAMASVPGWRERERLVSVGQVLFVLAGTPVFLLPISRQST